MPLIVTPGQFTRRAELYHQLGQLTAAGFGLIPALEQLKLNPPSASFREPIRRLLEELGHGSTFTEAMQCVGGWMPAFDIALLQAGEHSGRIDACFRLLADYYNDRARMMRQMMADLAYPVFLFHFAILIFAFVQFIGSHNWLIVLLGLVPAYAITAFLIYAGQSKHGERWRAWVESVLHPIPILGTGRHYLALSRLAAALEALLSAGVTIIEAWDLAAAASGSPALRRAVRAWKPAVLAGETPAEAVRACRRFPELFANLYSSGEISGKLDESLRRLHKYYQEEGSRKLQAVAQWTPRIIYLLVALGIGYYIVSFYANYFNQIGKAADGL